MSWVTCEPKSTMRILSWPASPLPNPPPLAGEGREGAPRTSEESRMVIATMCGRRRMRSRPRAELPPLTFHTGGRLPGADFAFFSVLRASLVRDLGWHRHHDEL